MKVVWQTTMRLLATRGRLAVVLIAALLTVGFGVTATPNEEVRGFVTFLALSLLIPLVSLAFAAAAFGDLVEDRSLVYLWLKPIARWRLAFAVTVATLTLALPPAVISLAAAIGFLGGGWEFIGRSAAAAALASAAYSSLFVGLGLAVRRALAWGLGYLLIGEGILAFFQPAISIRFHAQKVLDSGDSVGSGVAVLGGLVLAGLAFTTFLLLRKDVP